MQSVLSTAQPLCRKEDLFGDTNNSTDWTKVTSAQQGVILAYCSATACEQEAGCRAAEERRLVVSLDL